MRLRSVLLGTALSALSTLPANAADGWYVSLEGGAGWVHTIEGHEINNGVNFFGERIEVDTGWMIAATGGYEWGQWRFEGEVAYRRNDMKSIAFTTGYVSHDIDDIGQLTLMANALYDFELRPDLSLSLGAGLGADRLTFEWPGFGQPGGVEGDDWSLAYQLIAGLNYAFDPTCEAFVNYRFLSADGMDFTDRLNEQHLDAISTQTLSVGLRYHFGS